MRNRSADNTAIDPSDQTLRTIRRLKQQRSVTRNGKTTLLFNKKLTDQQKAFLWQGATALAYLKIDKRPYTTPWLKVDSFDSCAE
jgi:hypothetical protein